MQTRDQKRAMLWAILTMCLFGVQDYALNRSHSIQGTSYFIPLAFIMMGTGALIGFPFALYWDTQFRKAVLQLNPCLKCFTKSESNDGPSESLSVFTIVSQINFIQKSHVYKT